MNNETNDNQDEVRAAAAAMGRKGGKSKSPAKQAAGRKNIAKATASITPEQRAEYSKKGGAATKARWAAIRAAKAAQSGTAAADRPADEAATTDGKTGKGGKNE